MIRVVFDTSILVAAARSTRGASHRLLRLLPDARFQPAVSVPLFVEYLAVLTRPENLLGREPSSTRSYLDFLAAGHPQEIHYLWRPALPDPDDDMLLELAIAAGCRYIVTFNRTNFAGCGRFGIEALNPRSFLNVLGEPP